MTITISDGDGAPIRIDAEVAELVRWLGGIGSWRGEPICSPALPRSVVVVDW
jgi:hypothetical protein